MRGIDRVGCVGASPLSSSSCDAEPVLRIVAKTAGKPKWSASSRPVWNGSKCWVPLCSTPFSRSPSLAGGRSLYKCGGGAQQVPQTHCCEKVFFWNTPPHLALLRSLQFRQAWSHHFQASAAGLEILPLRIPVLAHSQHRGAIRFLSVQRCRVAHSPAADVTPVGREHSAHSV